MLFEVSVSTLPGQIDYFIKKMILTDRKIDNLLWDSENQIFREICINIINNMIG
jgi:hypothetical protein